MGLVGNMGMERVRWRKRTRGQSVGAPILLVLVLVIGLMVVAFVGKYAKDTTSDAMTKGKKESASLDKELGTHLMITAIFPTTDPAKNGYCGSISDNACELTSEDVNVAKLVVEVKNAGKKPLRANQLWDMKVYANDVPLTMDVLDDGGAPTHAADTEWGVTQEYNTIWQPSATKNVVIDRDCSDLIGLPGDALTIVVRPQAGTSGIIELTCERCCAMQPAQQLECAETCG